MTLVMHNRGTVHFMEVGWITYNFSRLESKGDHCVGMNGGQQHGVR